MSQTSIVTSPIVALPFGEAPGGRRGRRAVLAAAAVLGVLSLAFALRGHPAADVSPQEAAATSGQISASASVPTWREIANPEHIYALDAPTLSGAPVEYNARLHVADGAREDVLATGTLDGAAPAIRLRLSRHAADFASPTPLYAALAREGAAAGLSVSRSGLPEILPTRFGRFEIADLALARPDESPALACSGFRLILDAPDLSITGLACGARAAPIARAEVGCLIEHLDVAAIGNDRDLAAFFAQAKQDQTVACPAEARVADASPADAELSPISKKADNAATGRRRLRRR